MKWLAAPLFFMGIGAALVLGLVTGIALRVLRFLLEVVR